MIVHSVLLVSSSISASVSPELISDLDSRVRLDLQQTSDLFFLCVAASAIVVAVGCALEGPEILHEIFPKLFWWFTWPSKDRRDKFERGIKKIGLVGWLLVVLGVAAEGFFEVYDHHASGLLQTFDEIILAEAQKNAENAADAAQRANTAAGEAQGKAKAAADKANAADLQAKAASEESANAANTAGVAKRSAEDAENRALIVKRYTDSIVASVNSRVLDRNKFLSILAGKPKGTAEVWYEPDDHEAKEYADQIANVLGPDGAGWDVPPSEVLPRKNLPETYDERTPVLDKLRIDASATHGIAIAGGKVLDFSSPINEDLWTLLGEAIASIQGLEVIHWGGMRFRIPGSESHFIIVVGHHRTDVLRMTAPWQNPPPAPTSPNTSKPSTNP